MADDGALQVAVYVCAILETLGIRYAVGGSIASGLAGEPRATIGVDIVVQLNRLDRIANGATCSASCACRVHDWTEST
jgi:hypothetical protein